MRLNIPEVSVPLRLVEPWMFDLPNFYWNWAFWRQVCPPFEEPSVVPFRRVTLPTEMVIIVSKFDFRPRDPYPVRFHLRKKDNPSSLIHGRFWVGLTAANLANVERV